MKVVIDTSALLAVALDEPEKSRLVAATQETTLLAPAVLPFEIGNALSAMVKRGRLTAEQALDVLSVADGIAVQMVAVDLPAALEMACEAGIYAYDAYFLQTAATLNCPLLTLDQSMRRLAEARGIALLDES
jgi:predicted nucleic acid-binding protein